MASRKHNNFFLEQFIPLSLTFVTFGLLAFLVYVLIGLLNRGGGEDIFTRVHLTDVVVGMTIYLKTSVDFAIFMGNLMARFPGWKNRIAIEIGTAGGNALGTMIVLAIWNFFRQVEWLLALMILIAAFVLIRLAEEGMEHVGEEAEHMPAILRPFALRLKAGLHFFNRTTRPVLRYIIPELSMNTGKSKGWSGLFVTAFGIPFILGLDDFAGYVPVFNIVNVFGFSIGVLLGHMILNVLLFISPNNTIKAVKNPLVSFFGSLAFIALAVWGIYEVIKLLFLGH